MDAKIDKTATERASDRELVITRGFDAPAATIFKAWTTPDLLMRWWTPKSCGISFIACEVDARTGGGYRFVFSHPAAPEPMAFFGKYLEATPPALASVGRLVWTNEEGGEEGSVTTVTFTEKDGRTQLVLRDLYPSKQALDEAIASGSTSGFGEQFEQLDALLAG